MCSCPTPIRGVHAICQRLSIVSWGNLVSSTVQHILIEWRVVLYLCICCFQTFQAFVFSAWLPGFTFKPARAGDVTKRPNKTVLLLFCFTKHSFRTPAKNCESMVKRGGMQGRRYCTGWKPVQRYQKFHCQKGLTQGVLTYSLKKFIYIMVDGQECVSFADRAGRAIHDDRQFNGLILKHNP